MVAALRAEIQKDICKRLGFEINFCEMGGVDSLDILEDREIEQLSFYKTLRGSKAVDIGANIGVHSMALASLGFKVTAYEPDPVHYANLLKNIGPLVAPVNKAVTAKGGPQSFVRVLGNTTANHISGSRDFHGETELITVDSVSMKEACQDADIVKLDCEGLEFELLSEVRGPVFIVEVHDRKNAEGIFGLKLPMRTQMSGWRDVKTFEDMPTHYSHGCLVVYG